MSAAATASVGIACRQARTRGELADHHAIRHQVFVREQAVFAESDRDVHDADLATIRLVGYCDGVAAGSVRIFELEHATGLWQGDRLAVLAPFRTSGLGAPLVRCAVATAGALGGKQMVAHIQIANVTFFTRLGWTSEGEPETYVGLPHQRMLITLPPPEEGAAFAGRWSRVPPTADA
ncbi:MAG: GNAT family N-acetyltransferase [Chloroflexota bacterium]|nr:GNAT family N-acetyltransferase [Chloroflexota bacterium]